MKISSPGCLPNLPDCVWQVLLSTNSPALFSGVLMQNKQGLESPGVAGPVWSSHLEVTIAPIDLHLEVAHRDVLPPDFSLSSA